MQHRCMRILIVAPPVITVPPVSYGGSEAMIDLLARGCAAAGHDVLLDTTADSTCPVPRRWYFDRAQGLRAGSAVELRHVIHAYEKAGEFDIVHDHTLLGPLVAARSTDTPVVTTNRNPFDDGSRSVYRAVADRVPVIAISQAQARGAGDVPIARVIHHGIDVGSFPFDPAPSDYLVFLGRMSPTKGVHRAARVARAAGARLVIAAKMRQPDERRYFDEHVRGLLDDRIVYAGEVGGREKRELLAGARALVNPIRWPEPFGLVMIEALACGTPVVTFPSGAAPEIVHHGVTGFLCSDEADMVRRLGSVDRLDRRACRTSVEQLFSSEQMVSDHVELYESLLVRKQAA